MKTVTLDLSRHGVLMIDGKRYTPQRFDVSGKVLELYSVIALAKALGRTSSTIIEWEAYGLIPPPLYRITGKGTTVEQRRFYSREQIANLYQVVNRFPFGPGRRARFRGHFFAAFNQVFDEKEIINVAGLIVHSKVVPPVGSFGYTPSGQRKPDQLVRAEQKNHRGVAPARPARNSGDMGSAQQAHRTSATGRPQPEHVPQYARSPHPDVDHKKLTYRRRPAQAVS